MNRPTEPKHGPECPWCASIVPSEKVRGEPKAFCTDNCRTSYNNKMKSRGQAVVALAMTWRAGRGSSDLSKAAYAELCSILDSFNAEDREAGRPPVSIRTGQIMRSGTRYIDRRRS